MTRILAEKIRDNRFLPVTRRIQNRPFLVTAPMCVNPRNENVFGFP